MLFIYSGAGIYLTSFLYYTYPGCRLPVFVRIFAGISDLLILYVNYFIKVFSSGRQPIRRTAQAGCEPCYAVCPGGSLYMRCPGR